MIGLFWWALAEAAMPDASKEAARQNGLHYALGGVMSGPIDVDINLDTGDFTFRTVQRSTGVETSAEGRLDQEKINEIKKLAANAVGSGLETMACETARAKGEIMPPIMDALLSMTVTINGRSSEAPVRPDCWSEAAERLRDVAYTATSDAALTAAN